MSTFLEVISKTMLEIGLLERSLKSTGLYSPTYKGNMYDPSPKPAQGRNEKCNCGSGLKFKKCCGKEV